MRSSGWLIALLCCCTAGCELVADFDRDKIPEPPKDAATFDDAQIHFDASTSDAGTDGGAREEDGGDEDAGR